MYVAVMLNKGLCGLSIYTTVSISNCLELGPRAGGKLKTVKV